MVGAKKIMPSEFAGRLPRREKASTCAVSDAFENPQSYRGASDPVFGSHYIGWACKLRNRYRLPAGTPSVLQKDRPMHEHRRGFVRPFPDALLESTTAAPEVQGRQAGCQDWRGVPLEVGRRSGPLPPCGEVWGGGYWFQRLQHPTPTLPHKGGREQIGADASIGRHTRIGASDAMARQTNLPCQDIAGGEKRGGPNRSTAIG